ncbi:MAG: response regulator [Pseudobutyrivibrio sp.]|nr:response regulator [Pseudobutyrivibrio sp.]
MDFFNTTQENKKVAIVSSKDSFSVMGIKKKLQEASIDGISCRPSVFQIEEAIDEREPIIYYLDDDIYTVRGEDFLKELKNLCLEQEKLVILVGEKAEYEKAIEIIPKSSIVDWFSRPVDMDALLATVEKALNGEIAPSRKKHILIIDDDVTYMRMLLEWMKERYQITMMDSGSKAIHWLLENKGIDLILMDYEMPQMDGPTVSRMLKGDMNTREIPVMFLTGKSSKENVVKAVDTRPVDYILKSVDKMTLLNKLEDYFETTKAKEPLYNNEDDDDK